MKLTLGGLVAHLATKQTPIAHVLEQLKAFHEKSTSKQREEALLWQKESRACKSDIARLEGEIKEGKAGIQKQDESMKAADAKIKSLKEDIKKNEKDTKTLEKQMTDAQGDRDDAKKAFELWEKGYKETDKAVDKAIELMKKKECKDALFAQLESAVIYSAATITESELDEVRSFMQAPPSVKVEKCNPKRLQPIIEILKKLKNDGVDAYNEKSMGENNGVNAFALSKKAQESEKKNLSDEADNLDTQKTDQEGDLDAATAEFKSLNTELEKDEKSLTDEKNTCKTKYETFTEESKVRGDEQVALTEALDILSKVTGLQNPLTQKMAKSDFKTQGESNFLQLKSADPKQKVMNLLNKLAQSSHHKEYSALAAKVQASPFKVIMEKINVEIFRLKKEQTDSDTRHMWCEGETDSTKQKKERLSEKQNDLKMKVDDRTSKRDTQKKKVEDSQKTLEETLSAMKENSENRAADKKANLKTEEEAKEAEAALGKAVAVMREFYRKNDDSSAVTQSALLMQLGSGSEQHPVLKLLIEAQADYAKMGADARTAEVEQESAFEKVETDNMTKRDTMKQTIELSNNRANNLNGEIQQLKSKKKTTEKQIWDADQYLNKDLKAACVADKKAGEQTYEEKKKARANEVTGLKDALKTLEEAFKEQQGAGL